MNKCITHKLFFKRADGSLYSFVEALDFAREAGFTEIDYQFSGREYLLCDNWEEEFEKVMQTATQKNMKIRFTHLPFNYPASEEGWKDFEKASFRAMILAKRSGADAAAIHPCTYMKPKEEYDAVREREQVLRFLTPYCSEAAKIGLPLALENMRPGGTVRPNLVRYCCDVNELIGVADEIGTSICWDTGHANIAGQDQYESLKLIGKRLIDIHINDNFAGDDRHILPFVGNVDWDGFARGLRENGYHNSLNLEINCNKLPEALRKTYAEYLYRSGVQLEEMIRGNA